MQNRIYNRSKQVNDTWYIQCRGCNKYKTVEEFLKDSRQFLGVRGICRACFRYEKIRLRYELTKENLEKLLKFQNDICAICKCLFAGPLQVDHDHKTNKVRGMVCNSCNHIIAYNEAKPNPLKHIKEYLENPPARCLDKPVAVVIAFPEVKGGK